MSLSRAFTTRKLKLGSDGADSKNPQRSHTLRHKISGPVQLVHTTNMLSYNAPDLPRGASERANSAKSGKSSLDDSDSLATIESTPPTSPDVAPGEHMFSPKPNHLSGYFKNSTRPGPAEPEPAPAPAPMIPQRSPTHTKKNSIDAVARSRSVSRTSRDADVSAASRNLQAISRTPSLSTRSSANSTSSSRPLRSPRSPAVPMEPTAFAGPMPSKPHAAPTPLPVQPSIAPRHQAKDSNPFGAELAKVTELAEEFSSASQLEMVDEDTEYIRSKGLVRLRPDDYLSMIQGLSSMFFSEPAHSAPAAAAPLWI
ncbi:hypothetical protein BBK36DRAFT_1179461 [Trichoderma citrinoviride]|uniref:Uncharacterized protein n=1 Tax=Trichoderma citrinoviride TaxID=58853 RepID=A0A2T4B515_9HYPO|nr:hypothetical protein BBK36DRAFT_1179461 [Trichoderma citrinoviride]PTB64422.1 hypothetical protein BBK36DRAFT_1179461 [Trichoderma citrinoviride]